jgi:serine/threonine-protein kinase
MIGETIGGYRILESIGRGGVGTVYRARGGTLNRDVAIKVLNTATVDAVQIRRFETEATALSRLAHPGITAILEVAEHDDQRLIVMELLHGETLDRLVRRQGPLSPARAAALLVQALTALAEAHRVGIIHRDIKPGNLLLTDAGPLKILDFGVALIAGADRLTEAGLLVGTPAYMAPEQVTGGPVDARTDLYSVGLVFYHLVTGTLPFTGKTPALVADARVSSEPEPARSHMAGLPGWVDHVLERALTRQPAGRYQSADELCDALESGMRDHPAIASGIVIAPDAETMAMPIPSFAREKPAPAPASARGRAASRPSARSLLAAAVLVIAALIVLLLWAR